MVDFLLGSKQIIYFVVALISIGIFIILCKKYKLSRYQIMLFALLTLFWISICIVRSYRKIYMTGSPLVGGLGLDQLLAVNVVAAYGLISIFLRLPFFALSDYFKSRKFFVFLSLIFILISSVVVYFNPNYTSMLISSLALGVGASLLSMFNVMFADTFTKEQAIASVSILSIAPLFAEFLSAPIQFIFTSETVKQYGNIWLCSAVFAFIAVILLIFVKDNKEKVRNFSIKKFKEILSNKYFLVVCALGVITSLIKFSTSGANFVAYVKLNEIGMNSLGIAYLDVIFSFSQLIAGVLVGLYLKKKIGIKKTLLFGLILNVIFCVISIITTKPIILFISYSLNGFSYGLTYNVLIGLAMQPFEKNYREISMGIYQTFFAIGIYYGDKIYMYIYKLIGNPNVFYSYKTIFSIICGFSLLTIIITIYLFRGKNNKFLEN